MLATPSKLVLFSYVWPEPESSAAGVRTMALLQAFKSANWQITVLSPCAANAARTRLENFGVACHAVTANDSSIQELLKNLAADFVIFDRFVLEEQFGFHVAAACPTAVRIVDTQDLHFLRHSRELALKNKMPLTQIFANQIPWDEKAVLRECASIYRSDLTLLLSDFEISLLTNDFKIPAQILELTSFSFAPEMTELPTFSERKHFAFIGNYRHPPNHDGVLWLVNELWPTIHQKLPQTELHLYGAYPPKEISALHNPGKGIHFKGPCESAQRVLSTYRVNLAPLRFGAGIKGKIADGWCAGTPVVSTPIGAEGMGDPTAWGGLVADSTQSFCDAAAALYTEEALWQKCTAQGRTILRERFEPSRNGAKLIAKLLDLKQNLAAQRQQNLVGRILWREEARSTEYFSRWIELKNR